MLSKTKKNRLASHAHHQKQKNSTLLYWILSHLKLQKMFQYHLIQCLIK
jgi:hypothetical protein